MSLQWSGDPDEIRARALGIELGAQPVMTPAMWTGPLPGNPVKIDLERAIQDELIYHCADLRNDRDRWRRNCRLMVALWACTITPIVLGFIVWLSVK